MGALEAGRGAVEQRQVELPAAHSTVTLYRYTLPLCSTVTLFRYTLLPLLARLPVEYPLSTHWGRTVICLSHAPRTGTHGNG